jgi:hypothetical protein
MSTKNRTYSTKIAITNLIKQVFPRCFNQLPLNDVDYPFAVYSLFFRDNYPGMILELTVDLWDVDINQIGFQQKIDDLIDVLDFINYEDESIHMSGRIETIGDITAQEESLIKAQLIGEYNLYKVG